MAVVGKKVEMLPVADKEAVVMEWMKRMRRNAYPLFLDIWNLIFDVLMKNIRKKFQNDEK